MNVALYLRVSTEQQIEKYGLDVQHEKLQSYCQARGWTHVTDYIDGGYSGSNLNRPALQQLIKDIQAKKIDLVLVYRLDRLSRSQRDTLSLIEELFLPHHVEFISLSETIDTQTPFGRAAIGILSTFAQLERENIKERLYTCHQKMVQEEGLWAGGAGTTPYGYTRLARGQLVVNESERHHVQRIFESYLELKCVARVNKQLQAEGFKKLRYQRLSNILKSRLYLGEVSFAGEWHKGSHEALITEELFHAVQQARQAITNPNRMGPKNKTFTGLITCGHCGAVYKVYNRRITKADGEKAYESYYMCENRKLPKTNPQKCYNSRITREALEQQVMAQIKHLQQLNQKKYKTDLVAFKRKLKTIDQKTSKLIDLYTDGQLTKKIFQQKLNALTEQKQTLLQKISETEAKQKAPSAEENSTTLDSLVKHLIKNITIIDNTLDITWNN